MTSYYHIKYSSDRVISKMQIAARNRDEEARPLLEFSCPECPMIHDPSGQIAHLINRVADEREMLMRLTDHFFGRGLISPVSSRATG